MGLVAGIIFKNNFINSQVLWIPSILLRRKLCLNQVNLRDVCEASPGSPVRNLFASYNFMFPTSYLGLQIFYMLGG